MRERSKRDQRMYIGLKNLAEKWVILISNKDDGNAGTRMEVN